MVPAAMGLAMEEPDQDGDAVREIQGSVAVDLRAYETPPCAADLDLAIDPYRLRRVAAAAEMLAPRFARPYDDIRIDVMLLAPRRLPRHLVHVWQP